jgi:hypothetical protein
VLSQCFGHYAKSMLLSFRSVSCSEEVSFHAVSSVVKYFASLFYSTLTTLANCLIYIKIKKTGENIKPYERHEGCPVSAC